MPPRNGEVKSAKRFRQDSTDDEYVESASPPQSRHHEPLATRPRRLRIASTPEDEVVKHEVDHSFFGGSGKKRAMPESESEDDWEILPGPVSKPMKGKQASKPKADRSTPVSKGKGKAVLRPARSSAPLSGSSCRDPSPYLDDDAFFGASNRSTQSPPMSNAQFDDSEDQSDGPRPTRKAPKSRAKKAPLSPAAKEQKKAEARLKKLAKAKDSYWRRKEKDAEERALWDLERVPSSSTSRRVQASDHGSDAEPSGVIPEIVVDSTITFDDTHAARDYLMALARPLGFSVSVTSTQPEWCQLRCFRYSHSMYKEQKTTTKTGCPFRVTCGVRRMPGTGERRIVMIPKDLSHNHPPEIAAKLPNAFHKWTEEEVDRMMDMRARNIPVAKIAEKMRREGAIFASVTAVGSQIKKRAKRLKDQAGLVCPLCQGTGHDEKGCKKKSGGATKKRKGRGESEAEDDDENGRSEEGFEEEDGDAPEEEDFREDDHAYQGYSPARPEAALVEEDEDLGDVEASLGI